VPWTPADCIHHRTASLAAFAPLGPAVWHSGSGRSLHTSGLPLSPRSMEPLRKPIAPTHPWVEPRGGPKITLGPMGSVEPECCPKATIGLIGRSFRSCLFDRSAGKALLSYSALPALAAKSSPRSSTGAQRIGKLHTTPVAHGRMPDHEATAAVVQEKLYYLIALSLHSGRLRQGDFGTTKAGTCCTTKADTY
jgi:hypothetical protein